MAEVRQTDALIQALGLGPAQEEMRKKEVERKQQIASRADLRVEKTGKRSWHPSEDVIGVDFGAIDQDRYKTFGLSAFAPYTTITADKTLDTPEIIASTSGSFEGFRKEDRVLDSGEKLDGVKYVNIRDGQTAFVVTNNEIRLKSSSATPASMLAAASVLSHSGAQKAKIDGPLGAEVNNYAVRFGVDTNLPLEQQRVEQQQPAQQTEAAREQVKVDSPTVAAQQPMTGKELEDYLAAREKQFEQKFDEMNAAAENHPDVVAAYEESINRPPSRKGAAPPGGSSEHEVAEKYLRSLKAKADAKEALYGFDAMRTDFANQQEAIKATGLPMQDDPYAPDLAKTREAQATEPAKAKEVQAEQPAAEQQDSLAPMSESRDHAIAGPAKIGNYNREQDGAYRHANTGNVDFVDRGANRIGVAAGNEEAVRAVIELSKAKGWQSVNVAKISSLERRQALAIEATASGMGVTGYQLSPEDLEQAAERRREILAQEATRVSSIEGQKTTIDAGKTLEHLPNSVDFHFRQQDGSYKMPDSERQFSVKGSKIELDANADERTVGAALNLCKSNGVNEVKVDGPLAGQVYAQGVADHEIKTAGYEPTQADQEQVASLKERSAAEKETMKAVEAAESAPPDLSIKCEQQKVLDRQHEEHRGASR